MRTYLETRWGGGPQDPTLDDMRAALKELEVRDEEHPDTWLTDEEGWAVSAYDSGKVYLMDPEGTPVLECSIPNADFVIELWRLLQSGDRDRIRHTIMAGHEGGPARPFPAMPEGYLERIQADLLASDRQFYDWLGAEQPGNPCKADACTRNAIRFSVLCRVHHFASVKGRPSPFSD